MIALTALASAAGAAEKPAAMALLPRLVGEARLGPANALLHTVQDVGVVLGPAIGAVLLAVAPASIAFVVNAATFGLSALLISTMRIRGATIEGRVEEGVLGQIRHGLHTARVTPFVIPLFVVVAMVEFTYGAQTVQLVLYADRELGLSTGGYGVLLAAAGVGGVLSAIVNGRLATSTSVSVIVVAMGGVVCASQLGYAAVEVVGVAVIISVAAGAAMVAAEVVAETALARIIPADVLGRIMGVFDALSVAAMVAGALLAPVLIASTSLGTSFLVLGLAALLVTLACLGGLRGLDALSKRRADALASRVAVIESLPITMGVPRLVLEQLASASQVCPLPDGVDVVVQGAPAHAFYVVTEGRVVVHRDGQVLAHLGAGECFGERGLLDKAPRNATVTTEVRQHHPAVGRRSLARRPAVVGDARVRARPLDRRTVDPTGLDRGPVRRRRSVDRIVRFAGSTVLVVGAGYPGKRRAYQRMAELGVSPIVVDEPGHWSESLVADGLATAWLPAPVIGDADHDAAAIVDALDRSAIRPDGVFTIWENSVCVAARVAEALGLPGNPPESVDAARSKIRMRETSAQLGLPTPRAQRVRSLDELFAAAERSAFRPS